MDEEIEDIPVPINNELESRIAEAFLIFDSSGNKVIDAKDVGTVIRGLGACPSETQLQEIILAVEYAPIPGYVHLINFLPYVSQLFTEHRFEPASAAKLLETFNLLDKQGYGFLTKDFISTVMTQDGEPLTQEELGEMLDTAIDPITETVPYEYYINKLMIDPVNNNTYKLADDIEAAKPPPPPPPKRFSELMREMETAP